MVTIATKAQSTTEHFRALAYWSKETMTVADRDMAMFVLSLCSDRRRRLPWPYSKPGLPLLVQTSLSQFDKVMTKYASIKKGV